MKRIAITALSGLFTVAAGLLAAPVFLPVKVNVHPGITVTTLVASVTALLLIVLWPKIQDNVKNVEVKVDVPEKVDTSIDLHEVQKRDLECVLYLARRFSQLKAVEGTELCRKINDILFVKEFQNEKNSSDTSVSA